ncbi:MAG: hypothetical protein U0X86_000513 [Wolbachia endosymbiont of Xenopsylla cheopis]
MSTKQYNNMIKEYFSNNNKGFSSPYEVRFSELNIKVEVYSHNLKPNKIAQIKSDVEEAVKNFQNISNLKSSGSEKILKVYIFDDQADYKHLGSKFGFGLGDEGGKTYYRGEQGVFAEMYVYQAGGIHNFKHELAHGLTYVATGGKSLPTVLMEGVADYIEHSSDQSFNTQEGFSIDEAEKAIGTRDLNINNILKLQYSENHADNSLVYKMGHTLVMYLKEKGVLDDCLEAAKAGNNDRVEQLVRSSYDQKDFRDWLSQHNTETAMKEINALQVTKGEFIGTKEKIVDGEVKNVFYYKANIEKMDGESVGKFSTTSHYFTGDYLRVENSATRYCLDLSEQYRFMKLVDRNGEEKLTYCDKYGNAYKDSDEYKFHISQKIAHYEGKLQGDMIEELTYFDSSQARGMSKSSINFEHGKIYSVHSSGASSAKLMNGVSIYDGDNKIGELLTDYGYFAKVEGSDKDAFFFGDDLMGLYTRYEGGAYIAVTKESGEFTISLIDGRAVSKDGYYDKPHLHRNELLEPSINHIDKEKVDSSLLLKNTMFLDHSESDRAKEATIVKRGVLLDNKGTERAEDDVYEAKIEQDDFMYTFQNKGFYISTKGGLFIEDHGKGIRFQLPKEITHLKLVEKDGVKKLVPVTKDGNENPYGMPSNMPDEYRYIDLVFAHKYAKEDHSHKHVNIGLINFDKYRPGTIFEMRYDPNDYQIPRDANGNIIKLKHQSYFTKVKLLDEHGQEIGMLSNNFHNYTDKIFFSVDYNYSYTDFLASVAPQVNTEDKFDKELGKWTKVITFDQGKGDIGGTDRGYTDHQKIHTPANQKSQSHDEQMQGDQPVAYAQKAQMQSSNNNYRDYNVQYDKGQNSGARETKASIEAADRREQAEKEFNNKNEKLNELIDKGEVIMFEIVKGNSISGNKSIAVLQLTERSQKALGIDGSQYSGVELDMNRFHIKEVKHGNTIVTRFYDSASGGTALSSNKALYVLDNSDSNLSGFYMCLNKSDLMKSPTKWISVKNKFNIDSEMRDILFSHLDQQNKPYASKQVADSDIHSGQQVNDHVQKAQKQYQNNSDKQFSKKGIELKKAIEKGDVVVYRVKENSNSDDKHASTTFKMIKKSKEAEANNKYMKSVKLDSKDFDIRKVEHQEGVEDGDQLFYVLYKNDHSKSGFYKLGKDEVKFNALVKFLGDPERQCTYYDNIDNKFLSSEQNNHKQQYAYKAHEEQMQSDQPKASHKVDNHHAKHEDIVLKDTILSVSKSDTADKHGRYKAEIKVKYEDIRSLYEKASSSEEQQYILDFYYKLQENGFKIGVLPQEQYYFKGNKFIIKNKNGIELSRDEGKISLQLMHLKDHQGKDHLELVVLNKVNGKVIGNIHEIDDLSYGLLRSDSDILSHLETHELQHNLQFAEHHNEYDTYLMNGLEVQIFGHVH